MGGSGLGDAIVAWMQGSGANAQVAAASSTLPRSLLRADAERLAAARPRWRSTGPPRSTRSARAHLLGQRRRRAGRQTDQSDCLRACAAATSATVATASRSSRSTTPVRRRVRVTRSLRVDRRPPKVELRRHDNHVAVIVSDGGRLATSGLKGSSSGCPSVTATADRKAAAAGPRSPSHRAKGKKGSRGKADREDRSATPTSAPAPTASRSPPATTPATSSSFERKVRVG